ncbi:hypothetical protein NERG_02237 [Nematocida ausubeli]|uniref:HRDC domain-containing protein n=1 Tax=Nematocida ausubeli (strain ATCC PRA-371 / ERTm2) TaxID=1913371 RepID=H8ZF68_NEMA1|nr:hypothetical protein NERG_02237 [Nematocida ausubeli]
MLLPQAAERLLQTLTKYSSMIGQEKLVLPDLEIAERKGHCQGLIEEIDKELSIEPLSLLKQIEEILEDIHKKCVSTETAEEESILPEQTTILIQSQSKKRFVLSKNIPRPQINFKSRKDTYAMKSEGFCFSKQAKSAESTSAARDSAQQREGGLPDAKEMEVQSDVLKQAYNALKNVDSAADITPIIYYIKTEEECEMANSHIMQEKIIGVDIKTHKFRSYSGFTCYIQVATLESVYIFDMIELRNHSKLLTFWSEPSIVKVFYKASEKIAWLRKDLQYTVVSYIDLLSLHGYPEEPIRNLGRAVFYSTGRQVRKKLQLMDWRYKPVSDEMYTDLTEQVGYLLLAAAGMISRCTEKEFVSGYKYGVEAVQEPLTPEEFLLAKGIEPTESLVKIVMLRDFIAKQEDESPQFLMTDRQLVRFIKEQPSSPEQIFSLFKKISPLFKANMNNFVNLLHSKHKSSSFNMIALKDRS